jgi:hypothetical protein
MTMRWPIRVTLGERTRIWTPEADAMLARRYAAGDDVADIAAEATRMLSRATVTITITPKAVVSRVAYKGLRRRRL